MVIWCYNHRKLIHTRQLRVATPCFVHAQALLGFCNSRNGGSSRLSASRLKLTPKYCVVMGDGCCLERKLSVDRAAKGKVAHPWPLPRAALCG